MSLTTFPTRQLGLTDMHITRVGFGARFDAGARQGGRQGAQDDADALAAMRRALDRGINWIETAAVQGAGHSEDLVGQLLRQLPPSWRPHVFTKCALLGADAVPRRTRRISAAGGINGAVDASLRRLGVERIDLYQMQWPPADGMPLEEYWQALLDLKAAGKLRAVGLSNHNAAQLQDASRQGHVDTAEPAFSALRRDAAVDVMPWCEAHGTGVLVQGMPRNTLPELSGPGASLPTHTSTRDRAQATPAAMSRQGPRGAALEAAMTPVAERHGCTLTAVAVAWALAWPGVTGAVARARAPDEVDDWLGAATLVLDDDDMGRIAAAIEAAGTGPAAPPASARKSLWLIGSWF